jgi:acetyltransferase-like isoleucine patch superfamily enzyme
MISRFSNFYRKLFWTPEKYARFQGVSIGIDCNIQKVSFGSEPYLIEIGDHVQITDGTKIFTHGGGWVFRKEHGKLDYFGKVTIRNNVYIGNNSLIMPGVTIGSNVIVAAGSVVTKSIPDGKIAAGNPARIVGETKDFVEKIKQYDVGSKGMDYQGKKEYLLSLDDSNFIKK